MLKERLITRLKNFVRFSQVGVLVTLLSMALSYFFLKIAGTPLIITYVLLYLAMIFLSYLLNSFYTFKSGRNTKRLLLYYSSYGLSMVVGVILLSIFRKTLPFENWILAYMVIPFTMTINFLLSSQIFKKKNA